MTRSAIAFCLAIAVWCSYSSVGLSAHASGSALYLGDADVRGRVLVNSEEARSGQTVFPGSEITTERESRLVVSLGAQGRAEVLPQSNFKLDFGANGISGALASGSVRLSAPHGVGASVTTGECVVASVPEEDAVFTVRTDARQTHVAAHAGSVTLRTGSEVVRIAAGEEYTVGQATGGAHAGNSLTNREKAAIAFSIGGAFALILIVLAATDDDDDDVPPNPSPTQ